MSMDVGKVGLPGYSEFNGQTFTMEGEGHDVGGTDDSFHFAYAPMTGDGTITARVVRPMSSQWTKPGVMMRETSLLIRVTPQCYSCHTGAAH